MLIGRECAGSFVGRPPRKTQVPSWPRFFFGRVQEILHPVPELSKTLDTVCDSTNCSPNNHHASLQRLSWRFLTRTHHLSETVSRISPWVSSEAVGAVVEAEAVSAVVIAVVAVVEGEAVVEVSAYNKHPLCE